MKIYGLIPAYNEEKNIQEVVRRIKKIGIIPVVIDDASEDGTYEKARKTKAKILSHKKNRGKAEAIKTGLGFLSKKKFDYVVFIDADLQYIPEEARRLLKPLKNGEADFVAGYRNFKQVPFIRHKMGNFVWRTSFNLLFGTKFRDTNCGFVAMNSKAANLIRTKIKGGYILENSLFVHVLRNNLKVSHIPINVRYSETSQIHRGIRIVAGVSFYILHQGVKHRLGIGRKK